MMNEVLGGIKLIKLYAWEASFGELIQAVRKRELAQLVRAGYFNAFQGTLAWIGPAFVTLASFAVYALISPVPLTASKV